MNLGNVVAAILVGSFVSVILFQSVYMMISPLRWVNSRFALKSGEITEESVTSRWGRVWFRIIGLLMTITGIFVLYEFLFVMI